MDDDVTLMVNQSAWAARSHSWMQKLWVTCSIGTVCHSAELSHQQQQQQQQWTAAMTTTRLAVD